MTVVLPAVGEVDLSSRAFWTRPAQEQEAAFAALRQLPAPVFFAEPEVPYLEAGPGYYAVVRHADVDSISRSPALFCSGRGAVSIADLPPDLQEFYGSLISMDDPRHAKTRRIVSQAFSPRMLDALVADVERVARDAVGTARQRALAGDGTFDLVAEVSAPVPLLIICDLMGIPEQDRDLVFRASNVILSGGDPEYVSSREESLTAFLEAGGQLAGVMERLAAERLDRPTDDLTSALVNTEVDGERLSHQEIASFFILLCAAGNDTTRSAISAGVHALSLFPEQRAAWAADPGLTRSAVEEVVRWASPVRWMRRTATRDVEVGGHRYREGDKVLLFYSSANRDAAVFEAPDALDLSRWPNEHFGFGAPGPHVCLGAHLARREVAVTFRALFDLVPDLEVVGEPDRLQSSFINGTKRLRVRTAGR